MPSLVATTSASAHITFALRMDQQDLARCATPKKLVLGYLSSPKQFTLSIWDLFLA